MNWEKFLETNLKDYFKRKNLGNKFEDLEIKIIKEFKNRKVKLEEELMREDEYHSSDKFKLRAYDNTNFNPQSNMSQSRRTDINTKNEKKTDIQSNNVNILILERRKKE
jgi:hypothetical protein